MAMSRCYKSLDPFLLFLELSDLPFELGDALVTQGDHFGLGVGDEVWIGELGLFLLEVLFDLRLALAQAGASSACGSEIRPASGDGNVRRSMMAVADGGSDGVARQNFQLADLAHAAHHVEVGRQRGFVGRFGRLECDRDFARLRNIQLATNLTRAEDHCLDRR